MGLNGTAARRRRLDAARFDVLDEGAQTSGVAATPPPATRDRRPMRASTKNPFRVDRVTITHGPVRPTGISAEVSSIEDDRIRPLPKRAFNRRGIGNHRNSPSKT
jgi:hypothetical protein